MMMLASQDGQGREGLRMGLWGAAQAIAFAVGGFTGTVAVDITRQWVADPAHAYGATFIVEAMLFIAAARLGAGVKVQQQAMTSAATPTFGQVAAHEILADSR
jgi:BCD family chlorophyll transporter-like MFS transporter